jgi:hypothetical protein
MADEPPPPAPLTDKEQEAAFRQSMAFNTEAARSGLFAAAIDIAETMKKAGVPHGEACLVTGAVEFATQLWFQTMHRAGQPTKRSRAQLVKQVRDFFDKHEKAERRGTQAAKPN